VTALRRRPRADAEAAVIVAAGVAVAIVAGCAVVADARSSLTAAAVLAAAALVGWATRVHGAGLLVGLLLLGAVDALPGPNAETIHLVRTLQLTDGLAALLALALAWIVVTDPAARRPVGVEERMLRGWAAVVLILWMVAGVRADIAHGVPILNALFWGRQYLYLALLSPLFARALGSPSARQVAFVVVAAGVCVAAAGQMAAVIAGHPIAVVVHVNQLGQTEGLLRLYSGASTLIPAGVPFGLGLALLGTSRRARLAGGVVCAFAGAGIAVELTRALYLSTVVSLALTITLWLLVGDAAGRLGRRRLLQVAAFVAAATAAVVFVQPGTISHTVVDGVVARATSGITEATADSTLDSALVARTIERTDLKAYLGGDWELGKGLLDPSYFYVAEVPGGSIQNPDVGYLSAVMTIGVVGTIVVYSAFVFGLLRLAVLRVRGRAVAWDWLAFGTFSWLLMAVGASVTLAVMIDPIGAVPSAAILALACICAPRRGPHAPPRSATSSTH